MSSSYVYVEGEIERAAAEELLCVVCSTPLVAPLIHVPCGNMACKACIGDMEHCPQCVSKLLPGELVPVTVKRLLAHLAALQVYCPACRLSIPRSALEEHVKACPIGARLTVHLPPPFP